LSAKHIMQQGKAEQKKVETMKRNIEIMKARVNMSEELRGQIRKNEIKRRWTRNLTEKYCTLKHIRSCMIELRKEGRLPNNREDYRPNYKGIQYVFGENASEIVSYLHY
jgi:hypothetical protein